IRLFLIVDGEGEEVPPLDVALLAYGRDKHDGVGHADEHGAIGLPRDGAGLQRHLVGAVLEGSADFHDSDPCEKANGLRELPGAEGISKRFRAGKTGSEHQEPAQTPGTRGSTSQPETADQRLIAVLVDLLQVVEKLPALVHHAKQTATGVMILVMLI